jgi:hypothetical protein
MTNLEGGEPKVFDATMVHPPPAHQRTLNLARVLLRYPDDDRTGHRRHLLPGPEALRLKRCPIPPAPPPYQPAPEIN